MNIKRTTVIIVSTIIAINFVGLKAYSSDMAKHPKSKFSIRTTVDAPNTNMLDGLAFADNTDSNENKTTTVSRLNSSYPHSIYIGNTDEDIRFEKPRWSIKSNLLYNALGTINLGVEYRTSEKFSLDMLTNWNLWSFRDNRKFKHILIQPELRYWKERPFSGHFFGVHLHWAYYNIGNTKYPLRIRNRYEGWLVGAGISYGYRWNVKENFDIEATIGAGYAYLHHSKYEPEICGPLIKKDQKHYWGVTKVALNFIYKF